MKIHRQITLQFITISTAIFLLCGCGQEFFETDTDKYELVGVNADEIKENTFYVKNGTKFYQVYTPCANFTGTTQIADAKRLFWLGEDESLVPTYYKGELIAYCSTSADIGTVTIERFKDVGYSFGVYDLSFDTQGNLLLSTINVVGNSGASEGFVLAKTDDISIVTIDNSPISTAIIDTSGILTGYTQGEKHEFAYYSGTYYNTTTLQVDTHFFASFEMYFISDTTLTKNGYLAIEMPSDAKSGYYMINGQGIFKYYDFAKGEGEEETEMNETYYLTALEQIGEYSQQYLVSIPNNTTSLAINITYDLGNYTDSDIIAVLSSPEGIVYTFTGKSGEMSVMLEEAIAGKWTINVYPKDLSITNIYVSSAETKDESVSDTYTLIVDENKQNVVFYVTYTGGDTVWAYLTTENGEVTSMTQDTTTKTLSCDFAYAKTGKYTITFYHYADTAETSVGWYGDTTKDVTEYITVTE